MTPKELASAGRALYGERWQTSLATDLRVADRTMRRWLTGDTPIPDGVHGDVGDLLVKRVEAIGKIIVYSVNPYIRSVFHYPSCAAFQYDELGNVVLVHQGMAHWEDIPSMIEGAKQAASRERDRLRETEILRKLPFDLKFLIPIADLELSERTASCLKKDDIIYIGDLVQKTEAEMLRTSNFGRKSLNETKEVLAEMGLHLGMEPPGWRPENLEALAKVYASR